jgi:hypothetical protein
MRWRLWLGFKKEEEFDWMFCPGKKKTNLGKGGKVEVTVFFHEGGIILGQGIWGCWVAC